MLNYNNFSLTILKNAAKITLNNISLIKFGFIYNKLLFFVSLLYIIIF